MSTLVLVFDLIVGTLLTAVGLYCLSLMVIALWLSPSSRRWPTTEAEILDSRVKVLVGRGPVGSSGEPKIRYRYRVNDREYTSDNMTYDGWSTARDDAEKVVDRYRTGSLVPVYYHPQHPKWAVLEPGITLTKYLIPMVVVAVFLLFGIGLILSQVGPRGRSSPTTNETKRLL